LQNEKLKRQSDLVSGKEGGACSQQHWKRLITLSLADKTFSVGGRRCVDH